MQNLGGGQIRRGPANGEFFILGIRLLVYRVSNHYIAFKDVSRYNEFPFENGCEK